MSRINHRARAIGTQTVISATLLKKASSDPDQYQANISREHKGVVEFRIVEIFATTKAMALSKFDRLFETCR